MRERESIALGARVFVIGDVHAQDATLASALAYIEGRLEVLVGSERAGTILCVGDIADGRGDLEASCRLLETHGVVCIAGNHDDWALKGQLRQLKDAHTLSDATRRFLATLPPWRVFDTPVGGLLLGHGVADNDMCEFRPDTPEWVFEQAFESWARRRGDCARELVLHVGGHTHQTMARRLEGALLPHWALNAGTLRAREGRPPAVLELQLVLGDCVAIFHCLTGSAWSEVERVELDLGA